jgi:hypothetical protein
MMQLYPRNPINALVWQKQAPFAHAAKIGGIRCKVQDSGKTEYYYKGEWLQDGCVFVEIEKKQWRVMTPNRVDQLYRRLKDDN